MKSSSFPKLIRSTVAAALALATTAALAASPDGTFDVGTGQGALTNSFFLNSVFVQADDTLIVGGYFSNFNGTARSSFAKLTANGVVDTGYDARFNLNGGGNPIVTSAAGVGEGKVVAVATALFDVNGVTNFLNSVVVGNSPVRLNADASRDPEFASGEPGDIRAVQNGKLIVYRQFDLRRLNTDGTVDETFVRRIGEFGSITVQPDGKLLVFGYPYSDVANSDFPIRSTNMFFRLNADGSFDNSFTVQIPVGAIVSQPVFGTINHSAVQSDGKIIVVGNFTWLGTTARGSIARLNSNGTIDSTFNSARGFTQILSIPNVFNYTNSMLAHVVAIQSDGKVLVGGQFPEYNAAAVANLVRLTSTGARDSTFDAGAIQSVGWIGFQSNGDILVSGGSAGVFNNPQLGQALYASGTLAGRGIVRFAGTPPTPQAPVLSVQPESQSVTNYFAETGPTVSFSVAAGGTAPLAYQWLFNNQPIANGIMAASEPLIAGATTATLTISNVTTRNAGRYACVVSNSAGRVTSSVATLTVNGSSTPDATPPTIVITTPPTSVSRVTSNAVNFAGTATDVAGIAGVWIQRDSETPAAATGGANWSGSVELNPGTNIIRVFARDLSGNYSLTNRRALVYVVMLPLQLSTNGLGSVRGATNLQMFELGKRYQLTAQAAAGSVFSNWTGTITSPSNVLNFVMTSNFTAVANFVPNPFTSVAGNYNGLYNDPNDARHDRRGLFTAQVRPDGSFSGKLQNGTKKSSFTGKFNLEGYATNIVKLTGTNRLGMELWIDLHGGDRITGSITADGWTATNVADRAIYSRTSPSPYTNKFTVLIPGGEDASVVPGGHGYGSATIDATGKLKFTGSVADGTAASQSVPVSKDGWWPLYVPLYSGKGSIFGWVSFTNSPQPDLGGTVNWFKPALAAPRYYTNGFSMDSALIGSAYLSPGTNRLFAADGGFVAFSDGNLPAPFTNSLAFGPSAKVTNDSPNKLTLTLVPATGLLNGSVTRPDTNKVIAFKGVVLQKQGFGAGYFLGTNASGGVMIDPEP